jgi:hypothetical protein
MSKSIESRITMAEQRLTPAKRRIREIYIEGGLDSGVRAQIVRGSSIEGEPGEKLASLRTRVRAIAEAEGAEMIVYGGLPPPPTEFAVPPGMKEALARVGWATTDEIDRASNEGDPDQPLA